MEKQQESTPQAPQSKATKPTTRSRFKRISKPKEKVEKRIELGRCCTNGSGGRLTLDQCEGTHDACAVCENCIYDPGHEAARALVTAKLEAQGYTILRWVTEKYADENIHSKGHVIVTAEE